MTATGVNNTHSEIDPFQRNDFKITPQPVNNSFKHSGRKNKGSFDGRDNKENQSKKTHSKSKGKLQNQKHNKLTSLQ